MSSETLFENPQQRGVRIGQAVFLSWECRVWVSWAKSDRESDVLGAAARLADWVDESRVDLEGRPFETKVLLSNKGMAVEERAFSLAVSFNGHETFIPLFTHTPEEIMAALEEAERWVEKLRPQEE